MLETKFLFFIIHFNFLNFKFTFKLDFLIIIPFLLCQSKYYKFIWHKIYQHYYFLRNELLLLYNHLFTTFILEVVSNQKVIYLFGLRTKK